MQTFVVVVRWIMMLPGAAAAAWVCFLFAGVLANLTSLYAGFDRDGVLHHLYQQGMGGWAIGAALPYAGARIAPASKIEAFYILSAIMLVFAGATICLGYLTGHYPAVIEGIFTAVSSAVVANAVMRGSLKLK